MFWQRVGALLQCMKAVFQDADIVDVYAVCGMVSSVLQIKELKTHVKKQNTQLKELATAAKDAEQTAQTAEKQYKEHLKQLQSQLEGFEHQGGSATDTTQRASTAEAEPALHAELQALTRQLAEAQQEITALQQQQAKAGSATAVANSNPSTPSKAVVASPAHVSAAQDSAAQDSATQGSSTASAEKDKDTQLQVPLGWHCCESYCLCVWPADLAIVCTPSCL